MIRLYSCSHCGAVHLVSQGEPSPLSVLCKQCANPLSYNTGRMFVGEGIVEEAPLATEGLSRSQQMIAEECNTIREMLLEKNRAYGDSALRPVRLFSKASPVEQILVRLDDKISRLTRGEAAGEDVYLDLVGYIVLMRVAKRMESDP